MNKPQVILLSALAALAVACIAWAATATPQPVSESPAPVPHTMRVTVSSDGADDVSGDLLEDGEAGPMLHHGMGIPGMGRGRGMGHGAQLARVLRQLDLTASQQERMRVLHERQARRDIQARADLQLARLDLHTLLSAERPDAGAINAQIDRIGRLQTERAKERVATHLEALSLLTPGQRERARALHLRMGPGMGPGMGGLHGGTTIRRHIEVEGGQAGEPQ